MPVPVLLFGALICFALSAPIPRMGFSTVADSVKPPSSIVPIELCKEHFFTQTMDHFSWADPPEGKKTFQERYYVCSTYWKKTTPSGYPGPVFFYSGNEGDVQLYVNNTGLMWENAPKFGALMIFAEHRYYGKSQPFGSNTHKYLQFLSSEQALADYAVLLSEVLPQLGAEKSAVVAFGGSYGGMLAAWMRLKYPHIITGSIAASAPIANFYQQGYNQDAFYSTVTNDATSFGGCSDNCANNIRKALAAVFEEAKTDAGRLRISKALRLCKPITKEVDAYNVGFWVESASSFMAMGDYPYPSPYILNGKGILPAWPFRQACKHISDAMYPSNDTLIAHLADAMSIYYNYTKKEKCNNLTSTANAATNEVDFLWGYQSCTEMIMPMGTTGKTDMFFSDPWNLKGFIQECQTKYGVTPRVDWPNELYGGKRLHYASNLVFSNGLLDPWHPGGILHNITSTVRAYTMYAGHHLDLMFSNPADPPQVKWLRGKEVENIQIWVNQHYNALREQEQHPER